MCYRIVFRNYRAIAGISIGVQGLYTLSGGRGFLPAEAVRRGIALSGFRILDRSHSYGSTYSLGPVREDFGAWNAYSSMAYGSISRSVPGAILGGYGGIFSNRTNGGTATAFLLGSVRTQSNDSRREITNYTRSSHLLNNGNVRMNFYEREGYVYLTYVGTGTGNWAYMNELFGRMTFDFMIERNFRGASRRQE